MQVETSKKVGLKTALDFVEKPESFASKLMGKVGREMWAELRGEYVHKISNEVKTSQASISKTKTFTPPSSDRDVVWARVLRNLESACIKARRIKLSAQKLALFLRKQSFETDELEIRLSRPASATNELTSPLAELFEKIYRPKILYRATGIVLSDLTDTTSMQFSLFEDPVRAMANEPAFGAVDAAAARFGKHTVFFADCSKLGEQHKGSRGLAAERKGAILDGETNRQHVGIPILKNNLWP